MKRLTLTLVLALAMAGLALAQGTVKVGVFLELSGRMAVTGNDTLDGIKVAHEQQPTVNGMNVELSVCDNASTVEGSVACANRFLDEGVVAVLGSYSSSHSIPAAEVLQPAGTVMISTGSTNPATTQIGDYIFRIPYTDQFQGTVAAQYAYNDVGARKVAIFRQQDDDYSVGLASFFQDAFEGFGGTTTVLDYTSNNVDFSAQINNLRSFAPDMIYYTGFCAEAASLVPQLRQQGFNQPILGGDASDDSQCPEGGGTAFDGFTFTSFGEPEVLTGAAAERAGEFRAAFEKDYSLDHFTGFTLAGADAYKVLMKAIEDAGSTDHKAVRDALASLKDFPGVSGDITFAGTDGTPANRVMGLYAYKVNADGTWDKVVLKGISLE
ncbi:MAG: ABC transporter substrate-binding protein [Trueperaceae bacterium]|jgi:branched-chain amino acid transport system substrate-binding protein|nr:ABC transporter substrate-binding protein [Truepera sp.]HRN18762.1 ABC transporter substrate-binding protein [Trueperaceae bacterium]HRQ10813.1 ABC transporter substrate-binding protein [Trueperaceae bacterium]